MFRNILPDLIYILPAVAIALSCHEFAHSFIAYKLGDRSQKDSGRLSLNPIHHLDPIGTLCLILCGFGWAKPVQIDPYFFKDKKAGMIQSAMAGPLSNLIVGFLFTLLWGLLLKTGWAFHSIGGYFFTLCNYTIIINIGLAVFNLIPLPPLDGSKILMGILDEETYFKIMRYEQYISIILIIFLISGLLNGPLGYCREAILNFYMDIMQTIMF